MTRAVRAAGELVGIPLLDHVVVSRGGACAISGAFEHASRLERVSASVTSVTETLTATITAAGKRPAPDNLPK